MSSIDRAPGLSPELRAALFHSTVFAAPAVASAYLSIWLSDKGLTSEQIGIVNAVPVFLAFFFNMAIGRAADRASDWRVVIIYLAVIGGLAPLFFYVTHEFWGLALVLTLTNLPYSALVPVIDAATLRMTTRRGSNFSLIRAWGTVGYVVVAALSGLLIGWLGPNAFLPLFAGCALLRGALSFLLPQFRAKTVASPAERSAPLAGLATLMQPWFILPCVAFALVQATHFFIGAMGALVWKIDGVEEVWFGLLIAVGSASEATVMFFWRQIGGQQPARRLLIIAGLAAAVRWAVMATNPPIPVLFAAQLLHGITMPFAYFGIMHFIADWAPERIAAEAQGFPSALVQGFSVVTSLVFGWLIGSIGGHAYYVAAVMGLAAAGAAWMSLQLRPAHRPEELVHA